MDIEDAIRRIIREELERVLEPLLVESLHTGDKISKRRVASGADDFLTVAEAAEISRRHPESIYLALQSKDLRGSQRAKRGPWLIRRSDLEEWVLGR